MVLYKLLKSLGYLCLHTCKKCLFSVNMILLICLQPSSAGLEHEHEHEHFPQTNVSCIHGMMFKQVATALINLHYLSQTSTPLKWSKPSLHF